MSGRGDNKAERAVEHALGHAPADVLSLLEALRTALPEGLAQREGVVHALLHRLVRSGRVLAGGRSDRGLTLYRPAGAPAPTDTDEPGPAVPTDSHAAIARRVASAVRDPAARDRVQADVHAHLAALEADRRRDGFGAPRAVRHLLHRVDRGRPSVCVAASGGDSLRRLVLHEGPWLLGAALLFFVLKLFIVPIYRIPSKSMLPNLQVGDRVAVFLPGVGGLPDRWTIVTYELGGVTYVKRLVGLPGEEIAILHGDVFIDGERLVKPDDVRQALRSAVESWDFRAGTPRGWGEPATGPDGRSWTWRSGGFPAHPPGALGNSFVLRDGYARLDAERAAQGELVLTVTRGPGGSVDGAAVAWTLAVGQAGITLSEEHEKDGRPGASRVVVASRSTAPAAGSTRLELSYVDGILRATCADWSWQGARTAPDAALGLAVAERGPAGQLQTVALDRDLHYGHLGTQGVPVAGGRAFNPHRIAKHGFFCLGDNTTDSRDSRFRTPGDIPVGNLIGPVRVRIWPPGRWGSVR